jgi:TorA maturation chaperone TorD
MMQTQVSAMSPTGIDESEPDTSLMGARDHSLRTHVYTLLSRLLSSPPGDEVLTALQTVEARDPDGDIDLGSAWKDLQKIAGEMSVDALDDEFHSLFIGLGRGELIPHGSWYLTGFLMEKPLVQLRTDLAVLGVERQTDVKEPEDHAAALCDVMALLEGDGGGASYLTQAAFFQKHMQPWMGRFFHDMQVADSAKFYRAVGLFGERYIEIESEYFASGLGNTPDP